MRHEETIYGEGLPGLVVCNFGRQLVRMKRVILPNEDDLVDDGEGPSREMQKFRGLEKKSKSNLN